MKITVIKSAPANFDFGINEVLNIICEIMNELGVEVYVADLFDDPMHHYKGVLSDVVQQIAENIKNSDGVIFSTASCLFAPSSALQTLFEYLYYDYDDALIGKNCMSVVVALNGGERQAQDYLGKVLSYFGAYDSIRVCIDDKTAGLVIEDDTEERSILEKQVEDFYRIATQNRKFFVPKVNADSSSEAQSQPILEPKPFDPFEGLDDKEIELIDAVSPKKAAKLSEFKFEELNEEQEEDIDALTNFFSNMLDNSKNLENDVELPDFTMPLMPKSIGTGKSNKKQSSIKKSSSCLSATKKLPKKFNSHEASGVNSVMQLSISGEERFEGYIHINNSECTFSEGVFDMPDITILSDSAVWHNILNGDITAQKAFMIGQLKVRGNFTILNKFEKMFG